MRRRQWLVSGTTGWLAAMTLGIARRPAHAAALQGNVDGMVVEAVQLPAWAERRGRRQPLSPGERLATEQEVETGSAAGVVLRLPEGSLVQLGEKTRLGIQRLEVSPEGGSVSVRSQLKLFEGFFRFATSAVSKATGRRDISVSLRTATIGIRGTDFWTMTDAVHDAACLFEGRIDLDTRDQGALTLEQPTAFWARFFEQPVRPVGNATPEELARFLKSTALQAGQGVAVTGGRWRVVAAALPAARAASALATRLRNEGYPAVLKQREVNGRALHEVRINGLATREDAATVLGRVAGVEGVNGRVALSA